MEETLEEGPTVNFDRTTLEIAKQTERDSKEGTDSFTAKKNNVPTESVPVHNVPSIPFRHIDAHTFFSNRQEIVEQATKDCCRDLVDEAEADVIGTWLLTEISLWDTEKERLLFLTKGALYSVKYDFISLRILDYYKLSLSEVDTLVKGELEYPATSVVPRLNGLTDGVSSIVQNAVRRQWSSLDARSGLSQFEPRKRNLTGVRIMWNRGQPLPLVKKWNPFAKNIPWLTYTSHPLFWHKGSELEKARFDVEDFHKTIAQVLPEGCSVTDGSIIVENYLGLGAIIHNRSSLGFFKIRGKVSF
ncbi:tumor protein p63-regulated gene 1-like protein [Orussus abietinus]|uniref:tumor protein p63-regulated gene 1-like protein n=1 Tax=Orussus abietinus TaxID=222816 RepID=UPI000625344A|nr:tumor protein p63-regulated gene 1-like protein [Orussus abietinus]